jgi:hypothetical protein
LADRFDHLFNDRDALLDRDHHRGGSEVTEYQVLSHQVPSRDEGSNGNRGWQEIAVVEANSAEAAIRKAIWEQKIEDPVPFWRAVPTRSWPAEPIHVEVEVETKVTFK